MDNARSNRVWGASYNGEKMADVYIPPADPRIKKDTDAPTAARIRLAVSAARRITNYTNDVIMRVAKARDEGIAWREAEIVEIKNKEYATKHANAGFNLNVLAKHRNDLLREIASVKKSNKEIIDKEKARANAQIANLFRPFKRR